MEWRKKSLQSLSDSLTSKNDLSRPEKYMFLKWPYKAQTSRKFARKQGWADPTDHKPSSFVE